MRPDKDVMKYLAMVTQVGISMLAPIVLCVFLGAWLDEKSGWSTVPMLLILGILAGEGASARHPDFRSCHMDDFHLVYF